MTSGAIIIGCGGHSHVVASILEKKNIHVIGFLDTSYNGKEEVIFNKKLIGKPDLITNYDINSIEIYIAQGDNKIRKEYYNNFKKNNYKMPILVHQSVYIDQFVSIGSASQICLGTMLSTEVTIGEAVIINTGTIIDHESKIGNFCHLAPGTIIAGRVSIGNDVFIGMGTRVAPGITIGDNAIIGASSIILKDVPSNSRIYGVHH